MIAKDLINYMIPPLKLSDNVAMAIEWMGELKQTELPVSNQEKFLGLIYEETLLEAGITTEIGKLSLDATDSLVGEEQHYYEVLRKAYNLGTRLVAVNNSEGVYQGVISIDNVVEAFAHSTSVDTSGAILILQMDNRDYSLAEISRIIENDGAKILSSYIAPATSESGKLKVTVKIDREDISHLTVILEANGYRVDESFSESTSNDQDQERFDLLMNYLEI